MELKRKTANFVRRPEVMKALALAAALAGAVAVAAEPLTIKGLALGDTVDRLSLLGECTAAGSGYCIGKTVYGTTPADFTATYVAGKIDGVIISFPASKTAEVLAGLTQRFGDPTPGGCNTGVKGCYFWQSGGVRLRFIPIGQLTAVRMDLFAPPGGY